ncbi:MAG: RNA polymerase sigma factor FliA [Pantoea sp.]|uniref:RNA polymerase sigma factor FliA n=1 Tax=Pantoea septica TaxID=472695 RepID=A0ABX3UVT4_9GAMM|nr:MULTISPECIES: RNA polymerase sigma factor FliA [Pantoea]MDU5781146.1 RNA polymerase sigma factor FliA [Pantoea sp.]ORN02587.1 RNA polymerase sigma factor FliA [Pantoea septica]
MNGLYTPEGLANKNELWSKYGSLVRREALRLQARLPASVDIDDLIQAGSMGFLAAIDEYDPKKGIILPAWITQRVRWALMDELRARDWASRRIRNNAREMASAIQRIEQRNGKAATEAEIAAELQITPGEYHQMLSDTNTGQFCSLEELNELAGESFEATDDRHELLNPFHTLSLQSVTGKLAEEIKQLPEREQLLLSLYYQQELNMKEVSLILGLTETRISQLHSQALKRLRARMEKYM